MFTQFSYFGWSPDAGLRILRFQLVLCMSHMMSTRAQATSKTAHKGRPKANGTTGLKMTAVIPKIQAPFPQPVCVEAQARKAVLPHTTKRRRVHRGHMAMKRPPPGGTPRWRQDTAL